MGEQKRNLDDQLFRFVPDIVFRPTVGSSAPPVDSPEAFTHLRRGQALGTVAVRAAATATAEHKKRKKDAIEESGSEDDDDTMVKAADAENHALREWQEQMYLKQKKKDAKGD